RTSRCIARRVLATHFGLSRWSKGWCGEPGDSPWTAHTIRGVAGTRYDPVGRRLGMVILRYGHGWAGIRMSGGNGEPDAHHDRRWRRAGARPGLEATPEPTPERTLVRAGQRWHRGGGRESPHRRR